MEQKDVRWLQRYESYKKALARLTGITESERRAAELSDLEKSGLIQWFELAYELAWKVMQDLLVSKGYAFVKGPNGTLKMAIQDGLIDDQDGWRNMMQARNLSTHTYDQTEADSIVEDIYSTYSVLLSRLDAQLSREAGA